MGALRFLPEITGFDSRTPRLSAKEKRPLAFGVGHKHPPKSHIYRRLSQNLREARKGLTQIERIHRDAIRRNDEAAVSFAQRMHQLMVGMIAEAALAKIANDPAGFNDKERSLVLYGSQIDRWQKAVELAFPTPLSGALSPRGRCLHDRPVVGGSL